jgi:UDP-N-acetylmuramate--alanine ligase
MKGVDYGKFEGNVFKYGFNENNNIIIKDFNYINDMTNITLFYNGHNYFFKIPIKLARHQILDLVACISYCFVKLYNYNQILNGLQKIELPRHRFVVEKIDGVDIISDACVHYAGIVANLDEIKKRYPDKKINVIFEPIAYNRIINTFNLVCDALRKADYVYVCDILPLRETNIQEYNFSAKNIINEIKTAEYWNKKVDLYFNNNDLVVIFAPLSLESIKDKIKKI